MKNIRLSNGYQIIPAGTHIFQIVEVDYNDKLGVLKIKMKTAKGQTHVERFSLLNKNNQPNEGALNAFSYFARTAMGDNTITDVNPEDLVGFFIECDVEHDVRPSTKEEGKTVTFVKLTDKRYADGFGDDAPTAKPSEKKAASFDLDDLLG